MRRTITEALVQLPLPVLGMLAIAHAQYDTEVDCRQWAGGGGYTVLGAGLTTGLTLWNATQDKAKLDDGRVVDCVRITKRENHYGANPLPPVDYLFTFEGMRGLVDASFSMVEEA